MIVLRSLVDNTKVNTDELIAVVRFPVSWNEGTPTIVFALEMYILFTITLPILTRLVKASVRMPMLRSKDAEDI